MAQWVTYLSCKCKDLNSNSQIWKPAVIMYVCSLSAVTVRWGVGTEESLEAHRPATLAYAVEVETLSQMRRALPTPEVVLWLPHVRCSTHTSATSHIDRFKKSVTKWCFLFLVLAVFWVEDKEVAISLSCPHLASINTSYARKWSLRVSFFCLYEIMMKGEDRDICVNVWVNM